MSDFDENKPLVELRYERLPLDEIRRSNKVLALYGDKKIPLDVMETFDADTQNHIRRFQHGKRDVVSIQQKTIGSHMYPGWSPTLGI